MELNKLELIKKLAIISMFSNDRMMDLLVLKGGNALDIVYRIADRSSVDLDFSIEGELEPLGEYETIFANSLKKIFNEHGYVVFDIKITERPEIKDISIPEFWGGYKMEFKIIEKDHHFIFRENMEQLRRNASVVGPNQQKSFSIDISKWEYCNNKISYELDGYTVYVYSPEMMVFEKIRAICQQMPEYTEMIGKSFQTARARDFYDIFTVLKCYKSDLKLSEHLGLLRKIFERKNVSLSLLSKIAEYREYHRSDYASVEDTVKPRIKLKGYDYYFDYVINICDELTEALREK